MFGQLANAGQYTTLGSSPYGSLMASQGELNELYKAISAGQDTAPGGANPTGFALRPESLERMLKILTFRDDHVVFWKDINKLPAYSTVEEYNVLQSYGQERLSAFTAEGTLPIADDSVYERQLLRVKFMGTLRAVSHPMGLVTTAHGDVIDNETKAGTLWLMRQIERSLFFGDETVQPNEWFGYSHLISRPPAGATVTDDPTACTGVVIDLKNVGTGLGNTMTQDDLDEASERVYGSGNFGKLSDLYYSTSAHRRFANNVLGAGGANIRFNVDNQQGGPLMAGFTMKAFASQFGDINLHPDVFLSPRGDSPANLTTGFASGDAAERPGTPTLGISVGAGTGGEWGTATATYTYTVVAINAAGNSDAAATVTQAVAAATNEVEIDITQGAGPAPTGYVIYRSLPGATNILYEIGRTRFTASPQTYVDRNQIVAGTSMAFAFTMAPDVLSFRQLAPFTKIPLAQIDLNTRWAQVLYGAPALYAPAKCAMFINVGDV
jgi:hypothetical protein